VRGPSLIPSAETNHAEVEGAVSVLRDYQSEIIDDFDRLVARGVRSVLVTAPTGSVKTVIASAFLASAVAAGQRLLGWNEGPDRRREE